MATQSKTSRLVPLDEGGLRKTVGGRRVIDPLSLTGHTKERSSATISKAFASPELLWRTKHTTNRAKDAGDLAFLRRLIEEKGGKVPE